MADSGLVLASRIRAERAGVAIGSGIGGLGTILANETAPQGVGASPCLALYDSHGHRQHAFRTCPLCTFGLKGPEPLSRECVRDGFSCDRGGGGVDSAGSG